MKPPDMALDEARLVAHRLRVAMSAAQATRQVREKNQSKKRQKGKITPVIFGWRD